VPHPASRSCPDAASPAASSCRPGLSDRLGIVEKPIKRNEACRPLLGPDGKFLYPCGYCQKTFCSLSDLNRHMNFHEGMY
jgi:uncharacterized Zn-finger protein